MLAIAPIKDWAPLEWPGVNMAFLLSFFGTIVLTLAVIPYGKRRPVGKPVSWGEAMLGAVYAFGVMFLAFGIVPHQWIDHADRNLGWTQRQASSSDPAASCKPQADGGWFPFTLQYEAVRDIVVVLIHVIFFGLLIFIWLVVAEARPAVKPGTEIETSLVRPTAGEEGLTRWHAPTPTRR